MKDLLQAVKKSLNWHPLGFLTHPTPPKNTPRMKTERTYITKHALDLTIFHR